MAKQNNLVSADSAISEIPQSKQITIELLKPHTHAGRDYPAGARLAMDADSARWLISIGTAEEFL
ncbi:MULTISPECIES: DUF7210 family protein [Nitrosomonas]|uniref:DUF7210 domain-containing protein n=1 Tax=Nitrosomonas communis TaxID=44574 RepID=A0A0F7KDP2_9PROT|nr:MULTISPECIES: hypothetical protein [Nitrosomonas]AKH36897.1 hypothetical protein AAW31_02295 [Nitrosomonas communis]TYP83880.1 hypothetical protein BCL69_10406 [Nitrosomonas communis]UVS62007.1 hypothetical protein NX761_02420 [Nitrosomonas sp. PLL12]